MRLLSISLGAMKIVQTGSSRPLVTCVFLSLIDGRGLAMLPGQEKDSGAPDIFTTYAWVPIYESYGEISGRAYIGK